MSTSTENRELERFDNLNDLSESCDRDFDTKLTYIGAGAVALLFSFATTLDFSGVSSCLRHLFIVGISLLSSSVVAQITAFLVLKCLVLAQQKEHIKLMNDKKMSESNKRKIMNNRDWTLLKVSHAINWFVLLLFLSGVICTFIFIFKFMLQ